MNKKYQADKVVVIERAYVSCLHDTSIYELPPDEFINYLTKPCLAYEEINENFGWTQYVPLLGAKPFDSYAEAEAARLQYLYDNGVTDEEDFTL